MELLTRAYTTRTTEVDMELILGQMETFMMECIKKIKEMVMELTIGRMEEFT
jgi:hypothetical protein